MERDLELSHLGGEIFLLWARSSFHPHLCQHGDKNFTFAWFSSVQFSHSVVSDFLRPHELQHARPPCPSPTHGVHSVSSLKLMSIESVMPSSYLLLCCPLLLLPSIPPSIRVFSNESTLHIRWPKYWSLSFSIIPSKEHPGLISFRISVLGIHRCEIFRFREPTMLFHFI